MRGDPYAILLVGDDTAASALAHELALDGYRLRHAPRLEQGDAVSQHDGADLIILTAAGENARRFQELRALRAGDLDPDFNPGTRVLCISANRDVAEVLRAFDAGADDVIRSPFVHAELLARVQALMRRGVLSSAGVIQVGALRIDINTHTATFNGTPMRLRRLEYALLVHLAGDAARVHSKQELLDELWGYPPGGPTRTVDTHACRLRRALTDAGASGWLTAVRGVGYRLAPDGHGEPRVLRRREGA
jgi:DNA-binding response OmpR family regulator